MTENTERFVSLRLAARLARREVRRRPGRTVLVALLVAMPVAGMLVAAVVVRTNNKTQLQSWRTQYGMADAVVSPGTTATKYNDVRTLLASSRLVAGQGYLENRLLRTVDTHRANVDISTLPMRDPITRGIVQVISGRTPAGGNEIFLTRAAAHDLDVGVGDTLRLVRPARHDFEVSGIGEFAEGWGRISLVFPQGATIPWPEQAAIAPILVDLPNTVTADQLKRLVASPGAINWGLQVSPALLTPSYRDYGADDTERKVRWSWVIGALVLTVAGIVIAAAFAVGARRQLVTLGQLAANGAPPKMLRRVLFLQGTWTGIAGALLGVGFGAGALAALAPYADRVFRRDVHPYTVRPFDVIPIVLLGIAAATIAALLPARTTSRMPVLAALAGRRPLGKVPRWLPIAGACAAAGGLGLLALAVLGASGGGEGDSAGHWQLWAITAIFGGMAVLLGACAIAPAYVSVLEPAASRAQGSPRLAMRSLARQRTRTGAVVSAIAATSALAIASSALLLGAHAHDTAGAKYMRDDEVILFTTDGVNGFTAPPAGAISSAEQVLPKATTVQLLVPSRARTELSIRKLVRDHPIPNGIVPGTAVDGSALGPDGQTWAAIADRALLAEYDLSRHDRELLEARGALLIGPGDGYAEVALVTRPDATDTTPATTAPATTKPATRTFKAAMVGEREIVSYLIQSMPRLLVTPSKAKQLGMTPRPGLVVLRNPTKLTKDERNELLDVANDVQSSSANPNVSFQIDFEQSHLDTTIIQWALVGITLVLVLFVVAVNLALSATETRDERDVLTVVGAAPAALRSANGYKALLVTLMGAVLAVPVGFLPVAVFSIADNKNEPLVFPWLVVTLLIVALPVVAAAMTTVASGIALRLRPVRISTMAYD